MFLRQRAGSARDRARPDQTAVGIGDHEGTVEALVGRFRRYSYGLPGLVECLDRCWGAVDRQAQPAGADRRRSHELADVRQLLPFADTVTVLDPRSRVGELAHQILGH